MTDRTITVEAPGRATGQADMVKVQTEAAGKGETQTAARRDAEDRVGAIRDAVRPLGLDGDAFEQHESQIQHRSSLIDADESEPPYRATVECTLACDPSRSEDVFLAVGDAGGAVTDMDRVLAPDQYDELYERALSSAMKRARRRARAIAEAEGVAIGPVRSVAVCDRDGMDSIVAEALSEMELSHVDLDDIEVNATVEATFEIER